MIGISDIRNLIELEISPEKAAGIYFLCDGDEVVYVGQSTNVRVRVATWQSSGLFPNLPHFTRAFNKVYMLNCKPEDLDRLEAAFIRLFNPACNRSLGANAVGVRDTMIAVLSGAKVA